MAMKMRQSLAQIEEEFREQMEREQDRSERLRRTAVSRTRRRSIARAKKRSSMRYWLLVLSLIATAVGVAIGMLATLNYLLA